MALALAILFLAACPSGAVLQGTVYDSETLQEADGAIVRINTTPAQLKVAKGGSYSFFVPPGEYMLAASSGELSADEIVRIVDDGNYTLDLLLLPGNLLGEEENESLIDEGLSSEILPVGSGAKEGETAKDGLADAARSAVLLLLLAAAAFFIWKARAGKKRGEEPAEGRKERGLRKPKRAALEPVQKEVLALCASHDGAITQKELRLKLPYSEAKVSLILTELEQMGLVKRFKRGRGNIIKLLKK